MRDPVERVTYEPPDSVVVDRIQRAFPGDELREPLEQLITETLWDYFRAESIYCPILVKNPS